MSGFLLLAFWWSGLELVSKSTLSVWTLTILAFSGFANGSTMSTAKNPRNPHFPKPQAQQ